MTLMQLVLYRSRAGRNTPDDRMAASKVAERLGPVVPAAPALPHLGRGPLAVGHRLVVAGRGRGAVVGRPHAVDGGQRHLGVGLPGTAAQVPLVRARGSRSRADEAGERLVERGAVGTGGRGEATGQAGHAGVELLGAAPATRAPGGRGPTWRTWAWPSPPRCHRGAGWSASGRPGLRVMAPSAPGRPTRRATPRSSLEHLLQVRPQRTGPGQQRAVPGRGEVGPVLAEAVGQHLLLVHLAQRVGGHHPAEALGQLAPRAARSRARARRRTAGSRGWDRSTPGRSARATRRGGGHP